MTNKYELADEIADVFKNDVHYYRNTRRVERIGHSRLLYYEDITQEHGLRAFPDRLLMILNASGSKDVGGIANRANFEYLTEEWGEWESENGHPVTVFVHGYLQSYAILVNLDAASLEQLEELESVLRYLERNPILSDKVYHEIENERLDSALKTRVLKAFYTALMDRLYDTPFYDADLDYNEDTLKELWTAVYSDLNGRYVFESGGVTLTIDPEEVARQANLHNYPQFWSLIIHWDKLALPVQEFTPQQTWMPLSLFGFAPKAMFNVVFEELLPLPAESEEG